MNSLVLLIVMGAPLACSALCGQTKATSSTSAPEPQRSATTLPVQDLASPQAEALLAESKARYEANDLIQAAIGLKQYLLLRPNSSEAAFLLARLLERQNAPKDSLEWFTKAAALSTPSSEDLRFVGMDYVLLNDYPDALHWLQRSVQDDPKNAEAWYDLARASMMQGDFTTAERALTMSLHLQPGSVKAENNLGIVYEAQNRTSDAAQAYQRAIALQQSSTRPSEQPLLNYGTLLLTQQRSADALPLLNQAVLIAPRDAKVREQLAHALDQQGELAQAELQMQKAIDLTPKNAALHYQLGQMYRRSGDVEKSRQEMLLSSSLYGTRSSEDR